MRADLEKMGYMRLFERLQNATSLSELDGWFSRLCALALSEVHPAEALDLPMNKETEIYGDEPEMDEELPEAEPIAPRTGRALHSGAISSHSRLQWRPRCDTKTTRHQAPTAVQHWLATC